MDKLDYNLMKSYLLNLSDKIMAEKDYLGKLDAECGDGDFGIGMYKGFQNAKKAIEHRQDGDIGALLNAFGSAILSSVGGASGPMLGTLFIEAGRTVKGKGEVDLSDLSRMFQASLEKMQLRGGARVGDKTLIDALYPAVEALKEAAEARDGLRHALKAAAEAARKGAESTRDLIAKHGKARYLGEQTLGHLDPGAEVIELIFETLSDSV